VKILYILGSTRSGSTIVANVLGATPGFFGAGEMRFLWERLLQERHCGCGERVDRCPVWGEILRQQAGQAAPADIVRWDRATMRLHHILGLLRARPGHIPPGSPLASYLPVLVDAYQRASQLTRARVLVDSSKRPSGAALLRLLPETDSYILHLVRDPRAVAYSRRRAKPDPDQGSGAVMARSPALDTVLHWSAMNTVSDVVRWRHGQRSMLLRYEDFVARPLEVFHRILSFVGEQESKGPFLTDRSVELGTNHAVAGNPDRFAHGRTDIRADDRWRTSLRRSERALVTAFTLPLMLHYGYRP
jgi:Sulfotransferase family